MVVFRDAVRAVACLIVLGMLALGWLAAPVAHADTPPPVSTADPIEDTSGGDLTLTWLAVGAAAMVAVAAGVTVTVVGSVRSRQQVPELATATETAEVAEVVPTAAVVEPTSPYAARVSFAPPPPPHPEPTPPPPPDPARTPPRPSPEPARPAKTEPARPAKTEPARPARLEADTAWPELPPLEDAVRASRAEPAELDLPVAPRRAAVVGDWEDPQPRRAR